MSRKVIRAMSNAQKCAGIDTVLWGRIYIQDKQAHELDRQSAGRSCQQARCHNRAVLADNERPIR